ncbi:uncharacterized protein KY384_000013 [Bacidia gigantensis]|uniref:uncharacterized protein n=1 Tax=Bacidia gigantensis TaxID=2732470 RepID=UPI001D05412D|nr:uncharacterized protein KY384_000013 [Bacidia gigantensis]KAG8526420.1 hypothetical protein KY384_000013 [Bacidia gigantensis]
MKYITPVETTWSLSMVPPETCAAKEKKTKEETDAPNSGKDDKYVERDGNKISFVGPEHSAKKEQAADFDQSQRDCVNK